MPNCYCCGTKLSEENKSKEHIFPNACGGKLKSDKLLCKNCNSTLGNDSDAELSKQLNVFSNILDISRERGKPQDIKGTYKGRELFRSSDGTLRETKPTIEIKPKGDGVINISIIANNEKEVREVANGFKRKYSNIDEDDFLSKVQIKSEYLDKILFRDELTFGGEKALRSVCKTAVNFFLHKEGNTEQSKSYIKHLIPYLKKEKSLVCSHFFIPATPVYSIEKEEVSHYIHIKGDPLEKILFAYVEYFNLASFLVILNDQYYGEKIDHTYCYDVLQNKELSKDFHLNLTADEIRNYDFNKMPLEEEEQMNVNLRNRIDRIMEIAERRRSRRSLIHRLEQEAWLAVLKDCPKGVTFIIPKEKFREIMNEFMRLLTPYIMAQKPPLYDPPHHRNHPPTR